MKFQDSLDAWGLITKAGDQGDSAANEFTMRYVLGALYAKLTFEGLTNEMVLELLFSGDVPVRGPDRTKWVSRPDRFSRDQMIPLLCFLGANEAYGAYKQKLFKAHLKHFFLFAWNTRKNGLLEAPFKLPDITGPNIWAAWIRAYRVWWLYPLLCILDVYQLLNTALVSTQYLITGETDPDVRNLILLNHFGASRMLTIPSALTWVIMNKFKRNGSTVAEWGTNKFFDEDPLEPPMGQLLRLLLP